MCSIQQSSFLYVFCVWFVLCWQTPKVMRRLNMQGVWEAPPCVYAYTCTRTHMRRGIYDTIHTRWRIATETHNLCTHMHTRTYSHVYACIRIHIYIHMHIYTYIHVSTHTYMHIYTHTCTTFTYARMQASLKRRNGSDCAGSPTWQQEALPISLAAAFRRGIPLRCQQPNCPSTRNNR